MDVTNDIKYIGVDDHDIDLFEGQYTVPNGMAYNSYAVVDDKIAVFDTVDARFGDKWLANLDGALGGRKPFGEYQGFRGQIPRGEDCCVKSGVSDDETVFRNRFRRASSCCRRGK